MVLAGLLGSQQGHTQVDDEEGWLERRDALKEGSKMQLFR